MKKQNPRTKLLKDTWGFSREDLRKYNVAMLIRVEFKWDEKTTPPRLRKAFAGAAHALHFLAERQIMLQLAMDGLKPCSKVNWFYGWDKDKTITTIPIRESTR